MSIKLNDFRLPIVYATEGRQEFNNSSNKPIIVTAIDEKTYETSEYVVKLNASERMHIESRMREIIAAFMAIELSIPIVSPAVVNISEEFCKTLLGQSYYKKANNSIGYNVGSEYLKDAIILANDFQFNQYQSLENMGQWIFAFDLMIENIDRNKNKPNLFIKDDGFFIFDHELAFSFTQALIPNKEPWNISENDKNTWIKEHCLLSRLKGKITYLDAFCEKLPTLDNHFWSLSEKFIPKEWFVEDVFKKIKFHIDSIVSHKEIFIKNVKNILL